MSEKKKINLTTYRLRGILKKKDKGLYKRYESLWQFALDNYLKFMNIENFTDHGEDHVLNVEKNIFKLLTEKAKQKLSSYDIFCLLSSCCLHDIGMIAKKNSGEPYLKVRQDHHLRVRDILEKDYSKFGLNKQEGKLIGEICYNHGTSGLDELAPYNNWPIAELGTVNALLIGALLRMGDLLDLNFSRAPSLVIDLKKIKGLSLYHWKLHSKISDIKIDHNTKEISIHAIAENELDLSELYGLKNWIEKELSIVDEIFRGNEIFFDKVSLHTNLDKKNVLSKENPFLKLASFDWTKHIAFFGRNREIADIRDRVLSGKLLVLVGESGVGKTSLLNAGLKQELIEKGLYVFEIRVSQTFQEDLLKTIKAQFSQFKSKDIFKLLENISSAGFELAVFIDQFEELFTLHAHNGTKSKMLNFFKKILSNDIISAKIVLGLRKDFLAEMWDLSESENIPALYSRGNTYHLKRPTRENAKQIIVNTIKYINYSINDNIVEQLLNDFTLNDEGIYPPYIQIVCHEIFNQHKSIYKKESEKTPISLAIYRQFSRQDKTGVEKIIAEYFEEILDGFSFEERSVINEILAPMITYFYTKQRITYEQILDINDNRIDIDKTLGRLIEHRIIKKIETERNEYELIHDFLAKRILENKPALGVSSKISKAREYIENNFKKQISLKEIAENVGFSREHFSRIFKVEMRENFIDYLNKRRIEEAKKYIRKDPRVKVIDIYKQVGFTNQPHFTKIFKKVTGYTPNEYKKQIFERSNEIDISYNNLN